MFLVHYCNGAEIRQETMPEQTWNPSKSDGSIFEAFSRALPLPPESGSPATPSAVIFAREPAFSRSKSARSSEANCASHSESNIMAPPTTAFSVDWVSGATRRPDSRWQGRRRKFVSRLQSVKKIRQSFNLCWDWERSLDYGHENCHYSLSAHIVTILNHVCLSYPIVNFWMDLKACQ